MKRKTEESRWLEGGLSLQEVSKILGIPASTLRYWDKEGLVAFDRDQQNAYRQVSLFTILDLLDVLDYREMDVPICKIKQTPQMTADELLALLDENRIAQKNKIIKLQQILSKINLKEQALRRLQTLEQKKPTIVYRQMPAIYKVDLQDMDDVRKYLIPMQAADLLHADDAGYWMAGMWWENGCGKILRPADTQPMTYLNGLLRFERENRKENSNELFDLARKMGYRPQYVIFQFLAVARHPECGLCDYHECWIELVAE
ncbi:MerR family transcriptional regulator [Mannheimia granulomatis]|uniref:MerR family transcriptional regulator n=1 Tax=Mannheimia granulomatis TaxID=85402 RepID=UPI000518BA7A|nr:MerR family transcriptional regulator [Mannheimia granulomatis]QLB18358.1 hypothetical protein A6B41_02300 [Mannheimia granulomatis]